MAIHESEPDALRFARALARSTRSLMSAATYVECAIVLDRPPNVRRRSRLDDFLENLSISIAPFTAEHARVARETT